MGECGLAPAIASRRGEEATLLRKDLQPQAHRIHPNSVVDAQNRDGAVERSSSTQVAK
jgi:hypothetical protein